MPFQEIIQMIVELKDKISGRTRKVEESLKGLSKANKTLMMASRELGVDMATVQRGLSIQGLAVDKGGKIYNKFTGKVVDHNKAIQRAGYVTKRFRMEWLSVLFFGMAIQRLFGSLIGPTYEMVGAYEYWNAVMLMITLGPASEITGFINRLAKAINKLPSPVKEVVGWFIALMDKFGWLLGLIGQFTLGLAGIKLAFPAVFPVIMSFLRFFGLIGVAILAVIYGFSLLKMAVEKNWLHIRDISDIVSGFLLGKLKILGDWFREKIPNALSALKQSFVDRWNEIKEHIRIKKDEIVGFFKTIGDKIQTLWSNVADFAGRIRSSLISMIPRWVKTALEWGGIIPRGLDDFLISKGQLYRINPNDTVMGTKGGMSSSVVIQNPVINISSVVGRESTETIVREVIEKLGTGLVRVV